MSGHPNKTAFRGLLTLVGVPSCKPPKNASGHRVLLTEEVVLRALPGIIGMAVCYSEERNHAPQNKIGVITEAHLKPFDAISRAVYVSGHLFSWDFAEQVDKIRNTSASLGMSYEIALVKVPDITAELWTPTDFWFTGAAILPKRCAAYKDTWVGVAE